MNQKVWPDLGQIEYMAVNLVTLYLNPKSVTRFRTNRIWQWTIWSLHIPKLVPANNIGTAAAPAVKMVKAPPTTFVKDMSRSWIRNGVMQYYAYATISSIYVLASPWVLRLRFRIRNQWPFVIPEWPVFVQIPPDLTLFLVKFVKNLVTFVTPDLVVTLSM